MAALACRRRRVAPPAPATLLPVAEQSDGSSSGRPGRPWALIPEDVGVLICLSLGPTDLRSFTFVCRRTRDLALRDSIWKFYCSSRWGSAANFGVYSKAQDLYQDGNGWFPTRNGKQCLPCFDITQLMLHGSPCLTMDLRVTDSELIAVSEAPRRVKGKSKVHICDLGESIQVREEIEVSEANINCFDLAPGLICLGGDDSKVRLYRCSEGRHRLVGEYSTTSEVNDLRVTRENVAIAVRIHENRNPAGLDLIHLDRPDAKISIPGGSHAMREKFVHAIDGFQEGTSLSGLACSGEDPLTSSFSAMLFDFRRPLPCVVDLPVTSARQGFPAGTMLWPLRAGKSPTVFANLLHDEASGGGTVVMVDFRFPTMDICTRFHFPDAVEDFRYFDGGVYAACTDARSTLQRLHIHRSMVSEPTRTERLCSVVESYDPDPGSRDMREDLKVFSISARGFAVSFGESLALGTLANPRERGDFQEPRSPCCWSPRHSRSLLVPEPDA